MQTTAAVLHETGKPAPYAESQSLQIEEVTLEGPATGQVLVEVVAAGLCHSDLSVIDGSRPRPVPMVLGHEAAGIVRDTGPGVVDLRPDDHVVFSFVPMCGRCTYCLTGRPALCEKGNRSNAAGSLMDGSRPFRDMDGRQLHQHLGVSAFSNYTIVAQESLVRIDSSIALERAALVGCAVLTGVGAVVNTARVEPGSSVAVFGLGGVGLSAIMGAVLAGAWPVVAVDIVPEKLVLAQSIGASYALKADEQDAAQAIREITGGGADYVFEAVGNARVLGQAFAATRRGGKTVAMGLAHPDQKLDIPAVSIVGEARTLIGSYMGSAVPQRDIPRFLALYQAGKLPVDALYSRSVPLSEINSGFDALAGGHVVRQLVSFRAGSFTGSSIL